MIFFPLAILAIPGMLTDHSLRLIHYSGEDYHLAYLNFSFLFASVMSRELRLR